MESEPSLVATSYDIGGASSSDESQRDKGSSSTALKISLVPRPFPPPVFDRLQYANTEGEGLGNFVMCGYVR